MKNRFTFFLMLAGCVFLAWLIFPRLLQYILGDTSKTLFEFLSAAGPVGDSFGAINSLFTGLALAALVYAILVQVEQLKKQEENLYLYKNEVEKSLAHLERQDSWDRLKLKMDVLPQLCLIAGHRLRQTLQGIPGSRKGTRLSPIGGGPTWEEVATWKVELDSDFHLSLVKVESISAQIRDLKRNAEISRED